MIWGVIIGTYSSVFIAVGMLSRFDLKRVDQDDDGVEVPEYER
jgi:preprotein translocase subunit SecF